MDIPITLTLTINVPDGLTKYFASSADLTTPSETEEPIVPVMPLQMVVTAEPEKKTRKPRATKAEMAARKAAEAAGGQPKEAHEKKEESKEGPDLNAVRAALYEYSEREGKTGKDAMNMLAEICGEGVKADQIPTDKYAELVEALSA